jgi:hypothetical protein
MAPLIYFTFLRENKTLTRDNSNQIKIKELPIFFPEFDLIP